MLRIEKAVEINAPVEEVFTYVTDPTHLPEYHPGIAEVKDVERLPNGGYRYRTIDKVLGFRVKSTWEDVEFVRNERGVNEMHNPLMDVTAHAMFERLPGGRTRASNIAEVRLHGGPLGRLGELLLGKYMGRGAEMAIAVAKARMEVLAQCPR